MPKVEPTLLPSARKKALDQFRNLLIADGKLFDAAEILKAEGIPQGAAHLEVVRLWISKAADQIQDAVYEALAVGFDEGDVAVAAGE